MKQILFFASLFILISILPGLALAQSDTSAAKKATVMAVGGNDSANLKKDTISKVADTLKKTADTSVVAATPMNCYKQWMDAFTERGVKPMTDGVQEVVIAFKSKESCHCYLGKVEVTGGKIKAPLYVQTEGGEYKTFVAMGKKLDPEFVSAQGDALWQINSGMSALFQTVDQEYGRVFFYKTLNKNKQANKEAPSPSDLLNN